MLSCHYELPYAYGSPYLQCGCCCWLQLASVEVAFSMFRKDAPGAFCVLRQSIVVKRSDMMSPGRYGFQ